MKLGRNDPCHCGSGKKYKHCHYEEDRAAETKALREAAEAAAAANEAEESSDSDEKHHHGKHSGSKFFRDTGRGTHGKAGAAGGGSSRSTRGSQRGG